MPYLSIEPGNGEHQGRLCYCCPFDLFHDFICLFQHLQKDFNHVSALKQQEEQVKQRLGILKKKEDEAWARYREGGEKREMLKAGKLMKRIIVIPVSVTMSGTEFSYFLLSLYMLRN